MGYIYCITNKLNGKQYVGKTISTIDKRWKEHCRDYIRKRCEKRPLYTAMQKYGIDSFEIKELEFVAEGELLSEREIYWIQKLQTYGHNGYNATEGGDGKILYNESDILELYNKVKTVSDVCRILGCDHNTVAKFLNKYNINVEERKERARSKKVEQYSLDNKLLNTFDSAYKAGQYLKTIIITSSSSSKIGRNICRCASGERKTAYNYKWRYKEVLQNN